MYNSTWVYDVIGTSLSFIGLIVLIIYTFASAILGRWLAEKKGYSTLSWFWICFLFGLFGIITIAGAPINNKVRNQLEKSKKGNNSTDIKPGEEKCIHCGKYYDFAYRNCPHCGKEKNIIIIKQDKIESYGIKCFKCNRISKVIGNVKDFSLYECPYCKTKITEKNVQFTE